MTKYNMPSREEFSYLYIDLDMTQKELAEHYFVGRTTIIAWVRRFNLRKRRRNPDRLAKAAYTLHEGGFSYRQIAELLTMSTKMAQIYAKQYEERRKQYETL